MTADSRLRLHAGPHAGRCTEQGASGCAALPYAVPVSAGAVHVAGTRSFAAEVVGFARDAGWSVAGLLEPSAPERIGSTIHGLPVRALEDAPKGSRSAIVGTGAPARREIVARLKAAGWRLATLVHPVAHLAPSAAVGDGALVGPGAIVGACSTIGDHVVVGRGGLVGHHTVLGEFSTLGPGANVAGNVRVGSDAFIGMSAVVRDHVSVGAAAVVAMGAVVVADVPDGARVRGLPARAEPS
jgi:sugar O-acyltransferase (sialic acid O-acetyltransferase NeuD family)